MKEEEKLSLLLNSALLEIPGLLDELPQMLHAIDEGECIAVDKISDVAKKEYITNIFKSIPLLKKNAEYGWYKQQRDISVRSFLLGSMIDSGRIVEPRELSQAQQQAARSIPMNLMRLLEAFPALRDELPILLDQILDGNDVQLHSLGDEDLSEGLERFLRSLGMTVKRGNICIPDEDFSTVRRSLKSIYNSFYDYEDYQHRLQKAAKQNELQLVHSKHKNNNHHGNADISSDDDDSSSASSESDNDDKEIKNVQQTVEYVASNSNVSSNDDDDEDGAIPIRMQGPARPSDTELLQAAQLPSHYSEDEDNDDDDSDIGPQKMRLGTVHLPTHVTTGALPLGFIGVDIAVEDTHASNRKRGLSEIEEDSNNKSSDVLRREEWLLEPGESKALNALGGGGDSAIDPMAMFGKSRKFQTGKIAKKNAEAVIIQREYARTLMQQEEEKRREEAKLMNNEADEDNFDDEEAPRPLSLMEEHLVKRQRTEAERKGKPQERRPFDREKDVLSRRKVGDAEMFQLVKNAKELTNRFDQPIVQKSFL